ncbi:helix-turn-helix domain-containing protein [Agaribacter flavus]|uniref:Helix-turn-helix domain-containing protein n=1 Tax=Agaribacter flavus TaxID=1902781 RepID=A0ABV7FW52_9ALTE
MKFGSFLKQQRESKEWRQPEAAENIGIEQSYLSKLENDKAIPSPEVFEKLIDAYHFTITDLGKTLNDSEFEKLKDIVAVKDFIITHKKQQEKSLRAWLVGGLLAIMLGSAMLTYGYSIDGVEETHYLYESRGQLKENEPRYLYADFPNYHSFKHRLARNPEWKSSPLFARLDYQHQTTPQYHGPFYDLGDRRYHYENSTKITKKAHVLTKPLGAMFIVGSLAAFFISRRW